MKSVRALGTVIAVAVTLALGTAPVLTARSQAPALSWLGMAGLMLMLFGAGVYRLYGRRTERFGQ